MPTGTQHPQNSCTPQIWVQTQNSHPTVFLIRPLYSRLWCPSICISPPYPTKTSPASSLCAETGIPPLYHRRLTLTAKFLTTILQHPKTNTYKLIFHPSPAVQPNDNLRTHLQQQLNCTFKFKILNPILSATPPWVFTLFRGVNTHVTNFMLWHKGGLLNSNPD